MDFGLSPEQEMLRDTVGRCLSDICPLDHVRSCLDAGSAVSEFLAAENLVKPLLHLGLPDYYVEHAKPAQMLAECGLDQAGIEAAVRRRLLQLEQSSSWATLNLLELHHAVH